MVEAVIVSAARTPIGRAHKGSLIGVDAFELAELAIGAAVERSGIDPADIDDVVLAEALQGGGVIARYAAIQLGLLNAPGMSNNRHCAGGLSAVAIAAAAVRGGMDHALVAGGTESSSTAPMTSKRSAVGGAAAPWVSPSHFATEDAPAFDMTITVGENTARDRGLTRRDIDEWAAYSHERALASIDAGHFHNQIVPVKITQADGTVRLFDTDEHPRRGTTVETLSQLRLLHPELPGATVTAGNASGVNDAAAALVVVGDDYAAAHGLVPLARIRSWCSVAIEPARTGLAPSVAIPKAVERAGLTLADISLYEINEAFCSVPVATVRDLGIPQAQVNANGSGCSLGHPIAATGARMVVTMVNELRRRDGGLGCVSMCAGGGMGAAMVIEAL